MKRYIIFAVARTGSTLYAELLNAYYTTLPPYRSFQVEFTEDALLPTWELPIHHTHQLDVFQSAPEDYIKLISTRSILDSVVSYIVAKFTKIFSMVMMPKDDYYNKFKDTKILVNIEEFKDECRSFDRKYQAAFKIFNQSMHEKYILDYNIHATNHQEFYNTLNIDFSLPLDYLLTSKIVINKFLMIENLAEILEAFRSLELTYNFNDYFTMQQIENLLKEPQ
jgi:hypothetical protein